MEEENNTIQNEENVINSSENLNETNRIEESEDKASEKEPVNKLKEAIEWIVCIIIAVILALLFRYYVGVPTVVKNVSMQPTLLEKQRLILNRWGRTTSTMPNRYDIVTVEEPDTDHLVISIDDADFSNPVAVYNSPKGGFSGFVYNVLEIGKTSFIKRVIGLPGDHVEIKDGKVYINDKELDEPYLSDSVRTEASQGAFTNIVVPEGTVFIMGDNRGNSTDSRHFGCIPLEKIESKVLVRFWPLNLAGKVK